MFHFIAYVMILLGLSGHRSDLPLLFPEQLSSDLTSAQSDSLFCQYTYHEHVTNHKLVQPQLTFRFDLLCLLIKIIADVLLLDRMCQAVMCFML